MAGRAFPARAVVLDPNRVHPAMFLKPLPYFRMAIKAFKFRLAFAHVVTLCAVGWSGE